MKNLQEEFWPLDTWIESVFLFIWIQFALFWFLTAGSCASVLVRVCACAQTSHFANTT